MFGINASFSNTDMAPSPERSRTVTSSSLKLEPMTIFPKRLLRSGSDVARQNIAITSEATEISNPVSRGNPFETPPNETTTWRNALSLISKTRFQSSLRLSIDKAFPQCI